MNRNKEHCSESNMKQALLNGKIMTVAHCLLDKCYKNYLSYIKSKGGSEQDAEDIFWDVLYKVDEKSKKEKINLKTTTTVCGYIFGFVRYFWLNLQRFRANHPPNLPLHDHFDDFYADPDEIALISLIKKEELEAFHKCLEEALQLDWRYPIVLKAFQNQQKDDITMKEIGYKNRKGVSVVRKRLFSEIRKRLKDNLFNSTT